MVNDVLPLKCLSSISVTVQLYNQSHIANEIGILIKSRSYSKWKNVTDKLTENISKLPLITVLKDEVQSKIQPVGLQILNLIKRDEYKNVYSIYKRKPMDFMNRFWWTTHGTIDEQKTAKMFINNENIDIKYRYKLACVCCLESDIVSLWNQFNNSEKDHFYEGINHVFFYNERIFDYWTFFILDKMEVFNNRYFIRGTNVYAHMCEWSIENSNETAFNFFVRKLTNDEKALIFSELCVRAIKNKLANVLHFLISNMGQQHLEPLFQEHCNEIFEIFYETLPYRNYFVAIVKPFLNCLSGIKLMYLLLYIAKDITDNFHAGDSTLLRDILEQSPNTKSLVDDLKRLWIWTSTFLRPRDLCTFELILTSLSDSKKRQFAYSVTTKGELSTFFQTGKWQLLKLFLKCIFATEIEINDFKSVTLKKLNKQKWPYLNIVWWNSFEKFLAWGCTSEEKIKNLKKEVVLSMDIAFIELLKHESFQKADYLVKWQCPHEEIMKFKQNIIKQEIALHCSSLISYDDWKSVEKLVKWGSFSLQEEVGVRKRVSELCGSKLCHSFIAERAWHKVNQFLKWCSYSQQEDLDFKLKLWELQGVGLCSELMTDGWEAVETFLNWYNFPSWEEQINFKKLVWESKHNGKCLYTYLCKGDYDDVAKNFLIWCSFSMDDQENVNLECFIDHEFWNVFKLQYNEDVYSLFKCFFRHNNKNKRLRETLWFDQN